MVSKKRRRTSSVNGIENLRAFHGGDAVYRYHRIASAPVAFRTSLGSTAFPCDLLIF